MNTWKCGEVNCDNETVGLGESHGLRAIGWYVHTPAPAFTGYVMQQEPIPVQTTPADTIIRCPSHSPEGLERAERNARRFQGGMDVGSVIGTVVDIFGGGRRPGGAS